MDAGIVSSTAIPPQTLRKVINLAPRSKHLTPESRRPLPLALRARFPPSRSGKFRSDASSTAVGGKSSSPWDDAPFELLPSGGKAYLDEQDVVSFLDAPKELVPIDLESYNPAAYLWKKIGDIPEERRYRLLYTVKARLISKLWELAGTRYQDSKLAKRSASDLLSFGNSSEKSEIWNCRTSEGPFPPSWLNDFKKVIFHGKDGGIYGRIILGGPAVVGFAKFYSPLYFKVRQVMEVMSTEQPCDLAYEFGDGLLDLQNLPEGFPDPVKHRWPFNDHLVVYIRHAGPGVLVGQAWQEGKDLEQVPKKFCGEILLVKDYFCR